MLKVTLTPETAARAEKAKARIVKATRYVRVKSALGFLIVAETLAPKQENTNGQG